MKILTRSNRTASRIRSCRRQRFLAVAVSLTMAAIPALASTPAASAYTHKWNCHLGAYERCFDNTGREYNPWHAMAFDGVYEAGYCVKGETSSGGVIQFACGTGFSIAGIVCTSTETHAYGYNNRGVETEAGEADTEGGC